MPMGAGEFRRILSQMLWILRPVDRSITVSAPLRITQMFPNQPVLPPRNRGSAAASGASRRDEAAQRIAHEDGVGVIKIDRPQVGFRRAPRCQQLLPQDPGKQPCG